MLKVPVYPMLLENIKRLIEILIKGQFINIKIHKDNVWSIVCH
jgi:hypothetical protein